MHVWHEEKRHAPTATSTAAVKRGHSTVAASTAVRDLLGPHQDAVVLTLQSRRASRRSLRRLIGRCDSTLGVVSQQPACAFSSPAGGLGGHGGSIGGLPASAPRAPAAILGPVESCTAVSGLQGIGFNGAKEAEPGRHRGRRGQGAARGGGYAAGKQPARRKPLDAVASILAGPRRGGPSRWRWNRWRCWCSTPQRCGDAGREIRWITHGRRSARPSSRGSW